LFVTILLDPFFLRQCQGPEDSANPECPCPAPLGLLPPYPGTRTPFHPSFSKLLALHKRCASLAHVHCTMFLVWCPHRQTWLQLGCCTPDAVHSLMLTTGRLWQLINDQRLCCFLPSSKPVICVERC